jgi:hypothetical protein
MLEHAETEAIGQAVIGQGYRVICREAHFLLEEIAEAALDGKRKEHMELLATVPLLIIDDLGMRKLVLWSFFGRNFSRIWTTSPYSLAHWSNLF